MDAQDATVRLDAVTPWRQWAVALPVVAFALPLLVSGPQWLTGTLVNAFLFVAAQKLPRRLRWSVILLPSIAAVLHGVLFQSFTPFLALFVPFIWVGNALLVESFLWLRGYVPMPLAVLLSAVAKAVLLFLCAEVLFQAHVVPAIFLTVMGVLQLVTAIAGGCVAFGALRLATARS